MTLPPVVAAVADVALEVIDGLVAAVELIAEEDDCDADELGAAALDVAADDAALAEDDGLDEEDPDDAEDAEDTARDDVEAGEEVAVFAALEGEVLTLDEVTDDTADDALRFDDDVVDILKDTLYGRWI